MKKIDFSFVLPAFNEEKNIKKAIDQAKRYLSKKFKSFEIVAVNDGSSDTTYEIASSIAKIDKSVKIVNHTKNRGYGSAVWDGLRAARGELIFFTDSDLQFDLKDLGPFLKEITRSDVVVGYRVKRVEGLSRRLNVLGWKLACYVALGINFRDIDCAFKLFRKTALEKIKIDSRGATFSAELLFRLKQKGLQITQLPVKHLPRLYGSPTGSKISVILRAFSELYKLFIRTPEMVKSRARWLGISGLVALILSRFLFLSNSRDFFDSSEYLWREKIPELIRVLTSGHPPFHPMYVGLSNIFYRIGIVAHDGTTAGIIPSALLGCVSVIFIFLLAKNLFGRKVAWLTAIVYALLPFVYSSQLTMLVDPTMHGFYFASLFVFALALDNKGSKGLWLAILAGILLGGAAFTHTSIAFWVTAYLGIWIIKSDKIDFETIKKDYLKFILLAVFALWAIAGYVYLLRVAYILGYNDGKPTIRAALKYLLLGNVSDRNSISLYLSLKYYLTISTVLVGGLAILSWFKMLFKNFKNAVGFFVWFVPSTILTANYIYENLHGRAMMPALFPIVLLCVLLVLSIKQIYVRSILVFLIVLQVALLGFGGANKYRTMPAPYEEIYMMQKAIEGGGVFISSNVTRTFNEYSGQFISFGDVGQGANEAQKAINEQLTLGKKAYVSLDAILYPRRRFDGMFYDIRANAGGKAISQRTLLNNVFEEKSLFLVKMNKLFNQAFYEISNGKADRLIGLDDRAREHSFVLGRISSGGSPAKVVSINAYQKNLCMTDKSDITYGDFGFCLYRALSGNRDVEAWTYSDKDGWFYLPVSKNPYKIALGYSAEQSRLAGDGYFVESGATTINPEWVGSFSADELKTKINDLGSFYAVSKIENDEVKYDLYKFDVNLKKSNRIQGEDLVSETGMVMSEKDASNGVDMMSSDLANGYLVSGPYINLEPGKYKVDFRIKRTKDAGAITIDVISDLGKNELAKSEGKASDISTDFQDHTLEFEVKNSKAGENIEFRVKLNGSAAALDYIELNRI